MVSPKGQNTFSATFISRWVQHRLGKNGFAGPKCTVSENGHAYPASVALGSVIGSLHNKHGQARGEHCHCRDRHDDPSKAGARLALHQFLVRSDYQDCDEKEGR